MDQALESPAPLVPKVQIAILEREAGKVEDGSAPEEEGRELAW